MSRQSPRENRVLSTLFRAKRSKALPRVADGERVYAIGDIHGRLDLLDDLLDQIAIDDDARAPMATTLVFLGDFIDRGPDSRGVVERLRTIAGAGNRCIFLLGNHEEVLLRAIEGERGALSLFDRIGGRETLLSYGVSEEEYDNCLLGDLTDLMKARIPQEHVAFLRSAQAKYASGEYLFVHAGVRPGVSIDEQQDVETRWIRDEFLDYRGDFGRVIVHGHTISNDIEIRVNRIGVDVGAYRSGRLAAVGLEGADRWFLLSQAAPC
jgi:serine/threonine protein phosphatase 1